MATGDFTNDGRPDIVAANLGLNSPYQIHAGHPLKMYYGDFNRDGRLHIVEAYYDEAIEAYGEQRGTGGFRRRWQGRLGRLPKRRGDEALPEHNSPSRTAGGLH